MLAGFKNKMQNFFKSSFSSSNYLFKLFKTVLKKYPEKVLIG